jgi:para-aminobenzoate synthetase component 1
MAVHAIQARIHPSAEAVIAAAARRRDPAILDSADTAPGRGRYTIVACEPAEVLSCAAGDDPFELLRRRIAVRPVPANAAAVTAEVGFAGGWIGYFAYEAGRAIERLPATTASDAGLPLARFGFYDTAAVHDAISGRWTIVAVEDANSPGGNVQRRVETWQKLLADAQMSNVPPAPPTGEPIANMSLEQYLHKVERAREYIAAGDIFQVNLARRETYRQCEPAWVTYLRLRRCNPAEYAAFLAWGETVVEESPPHPPLFKGGRADAPPALQGGRRHRGASEEARFAPADERAESQADARAAILCASPELFLRLRGRGVISRPIKGTRPRRLDPAADAREQSELAGSPKDRAELAMIVDLVRNDLGRVCEYGSVRVSSPDSSVAYPYELEAHPTVHHLVAAVVGRLAEGHDAIDLVRACFPGGSITGAPKVRAMEIIDELEPTERSVYTGGIGWFGLDGSMTLNIAIRTLIASAGRIHVYAGGGIVADSQPMNEYEETCAKARGLLRALGVEPVEVPPLPAVDLRVR